jgi:AcrR family transcriptional regulator
MARPPDPEAKKRLLDAARTEFVAHGLDGARVENIARGAALSKGAFYLHFPSKADAFNELVGSVMGQLTELISCTMRDYEPCGPQDSGEFLQQWLDADVRLFEFLLDNRDVVGLILEGGGSGSTQHLVEEFALQTERQTAAYLQMGIAAGLYRPDLNVETTASFIAGGYDRVARRLLYSPDTQDLSALILSWQQQVIRGIGMPILAETANRMKPPRSERMCAEPESERP